MENEQVAALRALVVSEATSLHRRIDELRQGQAEFRGDQERQHEENRENTAEVARELKRMNSTVSRHDEAIVSIKVEHETTRKKVHDLANSLPQMIRSDIRIVLSLIIGTASVTAGVVWWIVHFSPAANVR